MMMMMMMMIQTGRLQESAEMFTRYTRLTNDSEAHVNVVDSCTLYRLSSLLFSKMVTNISFCKYC